jgi:hypothetical protein
MQGWRRALSLNVASTGADGAAIAHEALQEARVVVVVQDKCFGTGNKLAASGSGAAKRGIKNPAVARGPTGTCR